MTSEWADGWACCIFVCACVRVCVLSGSWFHQSVGVLVRRRAKALMSHLRCDGGLVVTRADYGRVGGGEGCLLISINFYFNFV